MHFEKKIIELAGGNSNSDLIFFQILYEDTELKELFLFLLENVLSLASRVKYAYIKSSYQETRCVSKQDLCVP